MYTIDFTTCTADDVIARSAICHPSLFAEMLRDASLMHARYARETYNATVREIAAKMAAECNSAANYVLLSTDRELSFSERIQAFGIAARLQCIPPATAQDIIAR